jgi:hypothetical protein
MKSRRPKIANSNIQKNYILIFVSLLAVVSSLIVPARMEAQGAGAVLSGSIVDSSGAKIPNTTVSIKNTLTGVTRTVVTDSVGFYSIPNLLPGTYDISFSAGGFTSVLQSNLVLTVGEERTLDQSLQVGLVSESVKVSATLATVQLGSSTMSSEVNDTTIRELPLNGRDWTQLAVLQAGIVPARTQPTSGNQGTTPRGNRGFGNELSDSGHRPSENSYRINGISVVDYANEGPGNVLGAALGVDAIQEFSVITTNYTAEYGRASGAIINAITKSGTNQFHGDAFWFLRDRNLDTKNYFGTTLPPYHLNQFGGSLGGPVKKNKTFFFVAYEGIRQDKSFIFNDLVPSAAARAGNLCSTPNGSCTPTNVIVNTLVAPFFGFYPLPNGGPIGNGDTGVFNTSGLSTFAENYVIARGDHKISDKDSLAVTWFRDQAPFITPDALLNVRNELSTDRQTGGLEETRAFGPALVNVARVAYSRSVGRNNVPVDAINPLAADHSFAAVPGGYAPILTVPGLTLMQGALGSPSYSNHVFNSFQFYDDAFLTRGTHSLKFGFSWERMQYNVLSVSQGNGNFTFPSLAGFLQNQPAAVSLSDPTLTREVGNRQSLFGVYLQDDWHWRPNLTLNLGVRYEPTTLPAEAHDGFQVIENLYGGGSPVPTKTLWSHNQTLLDFAPRVGFSWDPFRDGKTAVRGAFGIFDVLPLIWTYGLNNASAVPFQFTETSSSIAPGSFPSGAFATLGYDPKIANAAYYDQHPHRAYAMNWNLNIQRAITSSLTATVGYLGSHGLHEPFSTDNSNLVLPQLTSAGYLWPLPVGSGTRLNPNIGGIRAIQANDSVVYQGLHAQVQERMGSDFQMQGSYTWGKCFDYGSSAGVGDPFNNSIASLLFFAPGVRHGLCDYNVTQNFVLNYIWSLPSPKLGGAVGGYLLGGWEVGGILTAATGTPFTMFIGGDPTGQGGDPWPYPDRLTGQGCGNPVNSGNPGNYVKLNCFTPPVAPASFASLCQPAASSVAAVIPNTCMNLFGNAGRNSIIGPGLLNLDFSMFKNFPVPRISEAFRVQFRAEFFNILNHPNFQSPLDNNYIFNQDGTPVGGAGSIDSTTTDSREIQLGLKIYF